MKTRTFEDLVVWQKAHQYVLRIYEHTQAFPKGELFGLTSQMRRVATSIPANIAEGYKKRGAKDKIRLLNVAQGSLEESRYYLILARDFSTSIWLISGRALRKSAVSLRRTSKASSATSTPPDSWLLTPLLILARELQYIDPIDLRPSLEEVSRLLEAYVKGIERNHRPS